MIGYVLIIMIVLGIPTIKKVKRDNAYIKESERLHIQHLKELEREERKKQQSIIDYLTAKIDNLIYISELTEKELQAETNNKKILILTKQLQTIDDNIFKTQLKLEKELAKLED